MNETLLSAKGVTKHFAVRRGILGSKRGKVHAVDAVDLQLAFGETLGLVGESGCGKSTLGRLLLRLEQPDSGQICFDGNDITHTKERKLRPLRRMMQMIFQDPYGSLNPRMTIGSTIAEPLHVHRLVKSKKQGLERAAELLQQVGLRPDMLRRYPHQFSGGQRQRIGIARALALTPKLIIADEAVSALDVSIQAQIINLLQELKQKFRLSYLFIAHDLHVVMHVSDRVAVMYLGKIVELGTRADLEAKRAHPYTRALFESVLEPDPKTRRALSVVSGDLPNPISPPEGCAFHPRCPIAQKGLCDRQTPILRPLSPTHFVACHLA